MKRLSPNLLFLFDLAGVFLFAVEGATVGVVAHLDLLGLMVLAFATGLGGGIVRDILIGAVPPNSIKDWRYGAVAFAGGATVFLANQFVQGIRPELILTLDAAGLALFAVAGANKALDYGISPFVAALLGTVTGCGGGVIRDMFLAKIPNILHSDIYAMAAFAGAVVVVAGRRFKMPSVPVAALGGIVCFAVRMISVWQGWQLPKVSPSMP
ncbi:trimeric intracellular cation channel family protein [bacterium]|nr:MAG: trimeric intracellular cation channel family protein [bacterium]